MADIFRMFRGAMRAPAAAFSNTLQGLLGNDLLPIPGLFSEAVLL